MFDSFLNDLSDNESFKEIHFAKQSKTRFQDSKNFKMNQEISNLATEQSKKVIIPDQLDDEEDNDLSKEDYIQMALHYKAVCKSYKKQLIESHKTIKELHLTIEHLEHKNWNLKRQKLNEHNEHLRLLVDKCAIFCEKINQYSSDLTSDEDSACQIEREYPETKDELIISTLQNILKEKKEYNNFTNQFKNLVENLNLSKEIKLSNKPSYSTMTKALNETLKYVEKNSISKFQCKCNDTFDYNKRIPIESSSKNSKSRASSSSSSSLSSNRYSLNSVNQDRPNSHRPSQEFLLNCLNLFQNLFDVDCFLNVPTKMNEIYYKYGQLANFKKAIQNIFDSGENCTTEKLVCNVQNLYKLLNEKISSNFKELINKTDLNKVIDKFSMYDEYFPLFHKLLEQIMKSLEISRLDQIMPCIRALKILATPTLC